MRRPCSILVLCVLLGFCVSLAVPAEDVPETAYDESETLPYEATPQLSIHVTQNPVSEVAGRAPTGGLASRSAPAPSTQTQANELIGARGRLALFCTLLC